LSGGEEPDVAFGGHGFGNDSGSSSSSSSNDGDEGDSDPEPAGSGAGEVGGADAEMEGEVSGEELVARQAEMNALLAIQIMSLGQYKDI
jgi:hypothetical protein